MKRIPFFQHDLGAAELASLERALGDAILSTGDIVAEFEQRFAAYLDMPHVVGVTSCTAALHLALQALDVGAGDEVITTPMTFIATAAAILHAGARPVFVDVEPDTGNLDATRIAGAITARTKAIIPVHLFGQMCDMRAIRALADQHHLAVIEDAAHCIEGRRDGVRPGMLGDVSCFSFYATKSLTSGEGGALVTRDTTVAERVRVLRQLGLAANAGDRARLGYSYRDMSAMGWKYNMSNLQAAILLPQLARLEVNHHRRAARALRYRDQLCNAPQLTLPTVRPNTEHAWHILAPRVDGRIRDAVVAGLQREGVGVTVHYDPPVHLTSYFRDRFAYAPGAFPVAEHISATTISLPLYPSMSEDDVDEVAARLRSVLRSQKMENRKQSS
jgi:UDP-4-amino-4-deoxy-L-arabinose-oxoglutarate aminotransferase